MWQVARALLVASAIAFVVAIGFGAAPVTNPGVQECGSPALFAIRNTDDVRIPSPGSPEEPPNAVALRAQPRCRLRVDERLGRLGIAFGLGVVFGVSGAALGLADDRRSYRRAPRFESYLRERPVDIPADPWAQPVVPIEDLGERLPDIEWREVRVVLGVSALAFVGLPLLAPWSVVRAALDAFTPGWIAIGIGLVAVSYLLAALEVLVAIRMAERRDDPAPAGSAPSPTVAIEVALASSYTGRLLPEYGPSGLTVHHLVRTGMARPVAVGRIAVLETVAVVTHAVLLALIGLAALASGPVGGDSLEHGWLAVVFVIAMVSIGAFTGRRRYRNLVVRPDRGTPAALRQLAGRPAQLAAMVGACVALALVDALVLVAAVHAFGSSPPLVPVLAVSLVAAVAGVASITPDGAGVAEAVLVLGLVWAGVDAGTAVAAALLTRVLTFWLPVLPGWIALARLKRDNLL
jgi:uncharacterized membrane protein YbhN (UPF0104 family)